MRGKRRRKNTLWLAELHIKKWQFNEANFMYLCVCVCVLTQWHKNYLIVLNLKYFLLSKLVVFFLLFAFIFQLFQTFKNEGVFFFNKEERRKYFLRVIQMCYVYEFVRWGVVLDFKGEEIYAFKWKRWNWTCKRGCGEDMCTTVNLYTQLFLLSQSVS